MGASYPGKPQKPQPKWMKDVVERRLDEERARSASPDVRAATRDRELLEHVATIRRYLGWILAIMATWAVLTVIGVIVIVATSGGDAGG